MSPAVAKIEAYGYNVATSSAGDFKTNTDT